MENYTVSNAPDDFIQSLNIGASTETDTETGTETTTTTSDESQGSSNSTPTIIVFAILFGIILIAVIINKIRKVKRSKCKNCKEKYDFDDVEYRVSSYKNELSGNKLHQKATFKIACHCHNCGKVRNFSHEFYVGSADENGAQSYDVDDHIRRWLGIKK